MCSIKFSKQKSLHSFKTKGQCKQSQDSFSHLLYIGISDVTLQGNSLFC